MQRNDDPENDLARRDRSEFYARIPGHSANYSLHDLLPLYGEGFCFALKDAWRRYARNQPKQSASKIFYVLRRSLHILAQVGETNPKTPCGKLYRAFRDDHAERINRETFEGARDAVAERLLAAGERTAKNRTRASRVHNLNSLLRRLARLGYVPAVDPYRTDHLRLEKGAVPSLAQLTRSSGKSAPVGVASVSFNEHAEGMLELNIARLDALRSALASDLLAEYEVFQTGQAWLRREDLPTADEFDSALDAIAKSGRPRPSGVSRFDWLTERLRLHLNLETRDELFPMLVRQVHSRLLYGETNFSESRYAVLLGGFGSRNVIRHLESTGVATTAAFGLMLIETAFNVASLEDLPSDPFVGTAKHGKRLISTAAARKIRANGKVVEASFESTGLLEGEAYISVKGRNARLSGGDVIRIYKEMSQPLRERASPEVASSLWVVKSGRGQKVINDLVTMQAFWWPRLIETHACDPVIGGLRITRQSIRTTVLQINAARAGYGHELAQAVASHSKDSTTLGYLGEGWFRNQLARQIREFQNLLEAVFVQRVPNVHEAAGLTREKFLERLERANSVGLDFDLGCSRKQWTKAVPIARAGGCTPLLPCESCPVRKFAPSNENFRHLHLAHTALVRAEPHWTMQNPERWIAVWMPWRVVTEAYVRKIERGPYKLQYSRIRKAVDAELLSEAVVLPLIA